VPSPRHASRVRSAICFEDQLSDTLMVGDRKAVGCAQTRRGGAVLIHAAVLLRLDPRLQARVFGVTADRIADRLAPAVPNGDWREVGRAVAQGLAGALGGAVDRRPDRPELSDRFLAPYAQPRWAPVPPG
jgi:hypothetical protein